MIAKPWYWKAHVHQHPGGEIMMRKRYWNTVTSAFAASALACAIGAGGCGGSAAPEESLQQTASLAQGADIARTSSIVSSPAKALDVRRAPAPRRASPEEIEAHVTQIRTSREARMLR